MSWHLSQVSGTRSHHALRIMTDVHVSFTSRTTLWLRLPAPGHDGEISPLVAGAAKRHWCGVMSHDRNQGMKYEVTGATLG